MSGDAGIFIASVVNQSLKMTGAVLVRESAPLLPGYRIRIEF